MAATDTQDIVMAVSTEINFTNASEIQATDTTSTTSAEGACSSSSSTPPTSLDEVSIASESVTLSLLVTKPEEAAPEETTPDILPVIEHVPLPLTEAESQNESQTTPSAKRARRSRAAVATYNLGKLSNGTQPKRVTKDDNPPNRRRTVSGDTLVDHAPSFSATLDGMVKETDRLVRDGIDALDLQWSVRNLNTPRTTRRRLQQTQQQKESPRNTRQSSRLAGGQIENLATRLTAIGKKGKKSLGKSVSRMARELLRLQDTKEFAHVDDKPVVHTVWANGKLVEETSRPAASASPSKRANARASSSAQEAAREQAKQEELAPQIIAPKGRRVKKYLEKGLYAGQQPPADATKLLSTAEKKKLTQLPSLLPTDPPNKILPLPMFNGLRLLINGRDFKLPYNICNPLPPGQPKPDEWRKMTKSTSTRHIKLLLIRC
jgi:[histone H3]-lysine4 N-trimethyltransferase ASH1L